VKKILLILSLVLLPVLSNASGVPSSFTYQGKALNAAGTAPLLTTVSFTLSITDPSGACTLYQETQSNINLVPTNGIFAIQVGSAIGAAKRTSGTDPGLSMAQVFANAGTQLVPASGACASGYTPAANDVRKLHVIITPTSGSPITISPDLVINSTPNVMVAETIQGLTAASFNPSGSIIATGFATCPTGYLAMDGTSYPVATYPTLAAGLNYVYGGSGANFNVPNSGGVFLRGAGTSNVGGISYTGTPGTSQSDQMQGHVHQIASQMGPTGGNGGANQYGNSFITDTINSESIGAYYSSAPVADPYGNGNPRIGVETHPANTSVKYCIKY
jgi:microcystin-dependent protein